MPPKKGKQAENTTTLTRTGPKEMISHPSKSGKKREQVEKPTTTRALILRKQAMGTGEVTLSNKITGKEKLDLLAGTHPVAVSGDASGPLIPVQTKSSRKCPRQL